MGKNKYLNIPYASISDAQKLDIYLPNGKNFAKPYPVIVVSVNYRLANEAKFPAQIQDITATIRFVKANINKYNLNPNAIAVWGDYAGANLEALSATSGNKITELDDLILDNKEYSANVQACVDWFGPTDFSKMDDEFRQSDLVSQFIHKMIHLKAYILAVI